MPPTPESEYEPKANVSKCPLCKTGFGLTTWKYHCAWCGKVVCDDCSPRTFSLPPVHEEPHRVCNSCVPEAAAFAAQHHGKSGGGGGGGRVLGGGSSRGTEEEERAKRAQILAERMKKSAPPARQGSTGFGAGETEREMQARIREEIRKRDEERDRQARKAAATAAGVSQGQLPQGQSGSDATHSGVQSDSNAPTTDTGDAPPPTISADNDVNGDCDHATRPSAEPVGAASKEPPQSQSERKTNPALEAALRRQQQSAGSRGPAAAPVDPEKARLLRTIQEKLKQKSEDEPFGLRSMDVAKLRIYLRHLEEAGHLRR